MGKFSDLTEKIVSVEAGQAAILDLPPIESYPEPLVTWQTDQNTYTSSNLDIITGITHQLIILSTSEIHQKSYRFVFILLIFLCIHVSPLTGSIVYIYKSHHSLLL